MTPSYSVGRSVSLCSRFGKATTLTECIHNPAFHSKLSVTNHTLYKQFSPFCLPKPAMYVLSTTLSSNATLGGGFAGQGNCFKEPPGLILRQLVYRVIGNRDSQLVIHRSCDICAGTSTPRSSGGGSIDTGSFCKQHLIRVQVQARQPRHNCGASSACCTEYLGKP
jgi:hypothetical protein